MTLFNLSKSAFISIFALLIHISHSIYYTITVEEIKRNQSIENSRFDDSPEISFKNQKLVYLYEDRRYSFGVQEKNHHVTDWDPKTGTVLGSYGKGLFICKLIGNQLFYIPIPKLRIHFALMLAEKNKDEVKSHGEFNHSLRSIKLEKEDKEWITVQFRHDQRNYRLNLYFNQEYDRENFRFEAKGNLGILETNSNNPTNSTESNQQKSASHKHSRGEMTVPRHERLEYCNHCGSKDITFEYRKFNKRLNKNQYYYICLKCKKGSINNKYKILNVHRAERKHDERLSNIYKKFQSDLPKCKNTSCSYFNSNKKTILKRDNLAQSNVQKMNILFHCLECKKGMFFSSMDTLRNAAECKKKGSIVYCTEHGTDSRAYNTKYYLNRFVTSKLHLNFTPQGVEVYDAVNKMRGVANTPEASRYKIYSVDSDYNTVVGTVLRERLQKQNIDNKFDKSNFVQLGLGEHLFVLIYRAVNGKLLVNYYDFPLTTLGANSKSSITSLSISKAQDYFREINFQEKLSQNQTKNHSLKLILDTEYQNPKKNISDSQIVRVNGQTFILTKKFIAERQPPSHVSGKHLITHCPACKFNPVLYLGPEKKTHTYYCIKCNGSRAATTKQNRKLKSLQDKLQEHREEFGFEIPPCTESHCPTRGTNYAVRKKGKRKSGKLSYRCLMCNTVSSYSKDQLHKGDLFDGLFLEIKNKKKKLDSSQKKSSRPSKRPRGNK